MSLAPVVLFVYNRLQHVRKTVVALRENDLAKESSLFIFSDGPRSTRDVAAVTDVRTYLESVTGFKQITHIKRDSNLGLSKSVIAGVSSIVEQFGTIIVLEDDMVTSPYFLRYMNEGLRRYREEDRVISIHGYVYPVARALPETFFLRGADCWGWATWKRGWDLFNADGLALATELHARRLEREFDFNHSYPFTRMLRNQARGKNDSWAIRWNASAFLQNKLTLYPGRSLVENIGLDSSGTHCSTTDGFAVPLATQPIRIEDIPLDPHTEASSAFEDYFRRNRPSLATTGVRRLRKFLGIG